MKILGKYSYFILILLLANAIILELFLRWGEQYWRIFGMNTFNFIVVFYSPLIIGVFFTIPFNEKVIENKYLLFVILFYALYQIVFNLPMTLSEYAGHIGLKYISELSLRLSLLQIPLFYWFLFPYFDNDKLIKLFHLTSLLMIVFGIYNYTQGQFNLTNTGEIRILSGVTSIYFVITILDNLKLFGAKKNNIIIIILMIFGIILTVHRSVYLTLIIVLLIYIVSRKKGFEKFGTVFKVSFLFIIIMSVLLLIPGVMELFVSRTSNIFIPQDGNYYDRYMKNILAFEMFLKHKINGTYLSGYYYDVATVSEEFFWRPHNFIFEILATQGIVGMLFVSTIFFKIMRISWINRNDRLSELSFFVLLYYVLISLTNATFFYNSCTVVLTFFSALILWRNKVLKANLVAVK